MRKQEDLYDHFERFIGLRVFNCEYVKVEDILKHTKDEDGFRKYENISHFVRCAIIRLVKEEYPKIEKNVGRPKRK